MKSFRCVYLFVRNKKREKLILRCDVLIFISIARFILRIFFDLNFCFFPPIPWNCNHVHVHTHFTYSRLFFNRRRAFSAVFEFREFPFFLWNFSINLNLIKIYRISFGYNPQMTRLIRSIFRPYDRWNSNELLAAGENLFTIPFWNLLSPSFCVCVTIIIILKCIAYA